MPTWPQKLATAEEAVLAYLGPAADATWTPATAPVAVKHAILLLTTHYYEHRGDDLGLTNRDEADHLERDPEPARDVSRPGAGVDGHRGVSASRDARASERAGGPARVGLCDSTVGRHKSSTGWRRFSFAGGITRASRLRRRFIFEGRTFQVQSVTDVDERHDELQLICVEVVGRGGESVTH